MDQRLRDEVIHRHSLWRQGPENPSNPNPNPDSKKMKLATAGDGASGTPWPCPPPPRLPSDTPWPETRPSPAAAATNALTRQLKASNAFREAFVEPGSGDESGGDSDEGELDYWPDPGAERFQLFRRVFVEDGELRRYFEENSKAGEFFCFVCGGIGKKGSGKTFKSCLGLLQHAAAMAKPERNHSHRAFGLVVSKVLGWDFDKIPAVVLKGEPLGRTLEGNAGAEKRADNVEVPSDDGEGLVRNEGSSGKGVSVGVMDNVVSAKNSGGETVEKEGFDNLQTDDGKGHIESKGGLCGDTERGLETGNSQVKGNENEAMSQPRSEGKDEHRNQAEKNPSKDGDDLDSDDEEEEEEEEEEDPSENGDGDEEEDPSEDEEEDPSENGNEAKEEDPSEDGSEDEEEDPSEHSDGNDNQDENEGGTYENSTVCKSGSLDQPLAQLGNSQAFKQPMESTSEWPCEEAGVTIPSANIGWPVFTPKSASAASELSAEERAMLAADQLQHKAVKLCKEFFRTRSGLDRKEEEEEDSSDDSENENEDEDMSCDSKELDFFWKLFSEDDKLREFYPNSSGDRNFCCLVCCGIGKKEWKRFTGVALVQHSTAISKTRKKRAHRAYGQVICRVLGWDHGLKYRGIPAVYRRYTVYRLGPVPVTQI